MKTNTTEEKISNHRYNKWNIEETRKLFKVMHGLGIYTSKAGSNKIQSTVTGARI